MPGFGIHLLAGNAGFRMMRHRIERPREQSHHRFGTGMQKAEHPARALRLSMDYP